MLKKTLLSALLLGAAAFAVQPAGAAPWRHPFSHAHFAFHHDFRHFTPLEHRNWIGGNWHHMWWHGRYGWWWGVGGSFYWYPGPVYPYPAEVSSTYYDDDGYDDGYDDQGGPSGGYQGGPGGGYQGGPDQGYQGGPGDQGGGGYGTWYHCASPEGYYPYVKSCRKGWEAVPAQPNDMGGPQQGGQGYGPQGGPDYGPQGGPGPDDQGPPPNGQYGDQPPPPR
jgi:hypothetical protein